MKTRLFYAILVAAGVCLQGCTTSRAKDGEDTEKNPQENGWRFLSVSNVAALLPANMPFG